MPRTKVWKFSDLPVGARFETCSFAFKGTVIESSPNWCVAYFDSASGKNRTDVSPTTEVYWIAGDSEDTIVVDWKLKKLRPGLYYKKALKVLRDKGYSAFRF